MNLMGLDGEGVIPKHINIIIDEVATGQVMQAAKIHKFPGLSSIDGIKFAGLAMGVGNPRAVVENQGDIYAQFSGKALGAEKGSAGGNGHQVTMTLEFLQGFFGLS